MPEASIAARARWIEAGPFGSQPVPCSRMYCSAHRAADRLGEHGGVHRRSRRRRCGRRSRGRPPRCRPPCRPARRACAAMPSRHEMRLLRAGPAGDMAVLDLDHRAGRAHAGVRLERPLVLGLDHARRGLERLVDVADRLARPRACAPAPCGCGRRARPGPGTAAPRRPFDLELSGTALIASHSLSATTREEVVLAHHARARNVLDRAFVDLTGVAPATGGRIMRACTMPGTFMSVTNGSWPNTLGAMSARLIGLPTIL